MAWDRSERICRGCREVFQPRAHHQTRCRKSCGRNSDSRNGARTEERREHDLHFIGVDGEGHNFPDGSHDYVLLSVGERSLHLPRGERINHTHIFPFLWECFQEYPHASYVGFFLGYDFTMWLRDLPENRARMLFDPRAIQLRQRNRSGDNPRPFPVYLGEWEFDLLGLKRFKLRLRGTKDWMYVCDAGPYFACSFLHAVDPRGWAVPLITAEEYEIIARGKGERAAVVPPGTPVSPEMIRYNVMENGILARLMKLLNRGLVETEIRLDRTSWYGPGPAAQAWMNLVEAPRGEEIRAAVPDLARAAARESYYGGWFEITAHGPVPGTAWEYDINSAYPTVIAELPCLLHGRWESGVGDPPNVPATLTLVEARVEGSSRWFGAMLHRTPKGTILRPSRTEGWFWQEELEASHRAGFTDRVEHLRWVAYYGCGCPPPLRKIAGLYQGRLSVGKNSPQGKARKVVYNSVYGKCAQSVGKPRYSNPVYASLITSRCRSMILDAIATHPQGPPACLSVATDSVTFRTPHPGLNLSETELGAWDETRRENLTLIMPGLYWDDGSRANIEAGEDPKLKSRGISARYLAQKVRELDQQWSEWDWDPLGDYPGVTIPMDFSLISPRQALQRGKWHLAGVVQRDDTHQVSSNPTSKRDSVLVREEGLWRSFPYLEAPGGLRSTPYDGSFGEELDAQREEIILQDGALISVLNQMLREEVYCETFPASTTGILL